MFFVHNLCKIIHYLRKKKTIPDKFKTLWFGTKQITISKLVLVIKIHSNIIYMLTSPVVTLIVQLCRVYRDKLDRNFFPKFF